MTAQCWLHLPGDEHDVASLVGVRGGDGQVYPADLDCARLGADGWVDITEAEQINVGLPGTGVPS